MTDPRPCRFCGQLISQDIYGYWFTTNPSNDHPWLCAANPGHPVETAHLPETRP